MRTLADYKGIELRMRRAAEHASGRARQEYLHAAAFARRRIKQIEGKRLVRVTGSLLLAWLLGLLGGCCAIHGLGRDLQDWTRSNVDRRPAQSLPWESGRRGDLPY